MRIEIDKILEANVEDIPKEIPEEWKEYVKAKRETTLLRRQFDLIKREVEGKIKSLEICPPSQNKVPENVYTATEIGYLINKHCSVVGKLMASTGLKKDAIKEIIDIKDDFSIVYKYYYKYETVISLLLEEELITIIPTEEELKKLVFICRKLNNGFTITKEEEELLPLYYFKQIFCLYRRYR